MEHKPDWCFDGADEVDANNWLIKGRGAAMFKEKLNIANSKITYILVDKSKMIKELDTNFPIPVECYPLALNSVKEKLIEIVAENLPKGVGAIIRTTASKATKTEIKWFEECLLLSFLSRRFYEILF